MAGGEAAALFIGPDGNFDRGFGFQSGVIQRPHNFQSRQHAIRTVELAAGWLAVQMAAGNNGRQGIVPARAPGEHIAHGIVGDGAARFLAPVAKQVA